MEPIIDRYLPTLDRIFNKARNIQESHKRQEQALNSITGDQASSLEARERIRVEQAIGLQAWDDLIDELKQLRGEFVALNRAEKVLDSWDRSSLQHHEVVIGEHIETAELEIEVRNSFADVLTILKNIRHILTYRPELSAFLAVIDEGIVDGAVEDARVIRAEPKGDSKYKLDILGGSDA